MPSLEIPETELVTRCAVCYETFTPELPPKQLQCGHSFCETCIGVVDRCPLCTLEFSPGSSITNYGMLALVEQIKRATIEKKDYIEIFIKNLIGSTFAIEVVEDESIKSVKEKIEKREGIAPDMMRLVFEGKPLLDELTLAHYKVDHQSTIHMAMRLLGGVPPFATESLTSCTVCYENYCSSRPPKQLPCGHSFCDSCVQQFTQCPRCKASYTPAGITASNLDMLSVVEVVNQMNKPDNTCAPEDGRMKIFVRGVNGETFSLDVESSETVASVKAKIEHLKGIPPDLQRLIYGGKQFSDENTLADYKVMHETVIMLVLRLRGGLSFTVKTLTGKVMLLDLAESTTIKEVKEKIEEKEGIPPEQQNLIFSGKKLEDNQLVAELKDDKKPVVVHMVLMLRGGF